MDNTIIISDDTKINEADLIRSIVLNDVYASCLFFESKWKFIVSGWVLNLKIIYFI